MELGAKLVQPLTSTDPFSGVVNGWVLKSLSDLVPFGICDGFVESALAGNDEVVGMDDGGRHAQQKESLTQQKHCVWYGVVSMVDMCNEISKVVVVCGCASLAI